MVIKLGPPVPASSTKNSKLYAPTDSEHEFFKVEIENWLPIRFELRSP